MHLCTCTDCDSDRKRHRSLMLILCTLLLLRDMIWSYQMNWCDLLFTLISLRVLWWKVSVLVMFSSFLTYQSWFNKAVFLLDSCCISSGPQGSIQWGMAAWLCAIQMISLSTDPLLWQQMSPRWLILLFSFHC